MSADTVVDKAELRTLVADVLDVEPADLGDDVDFVGDLGVDSLIALELAVTLERRYGVTVEQDEVTGVRTLGDVYRLLCERMAR